MRKKFNRLLSLFLSLLITVSGLIIINPVTANAAITSSISVTNYGSIYRHYRAGSSYWTCQFNRFSVGSTPAYCLAELDTAPSSGMTYASPSGETNFRYTVAKLSDSVAASLGISGDNKYMGTQFALWGKYCGAGDSTVGTDTDSQQVLTMARTLYNKANSSLQVPDNTINLSFSKTGGGYIEGSNYVIGDYTIYGTWTSTSIISAGTTDGAFLSQKDSNHLRVLIPLANITSGYEATVTLSGTKYYNQFFRYSHSGYQDIGTMQSSSVSTSTQIREIMDDPKGTINIYKTDSHSGAALAGAVFRITNESTGSYYTLMTGKDGFTYKDRLPIGSYTVEEITPPTGYEKSGQTKWTGQQITDSASNLTYNVKNDPLFGSIKVVKSAEDGAISGRIFNISGNGVNANITTGADGTATLNSLYQGTYTVSEVNTPAQYIAPSAQAVTVTPNVTTSVHFSNILKKGYVELTKKDTETGGNLPNAVFGIYNSANTRIGALQTDSNGYAKSGLINYGSYYLMEETAPNGYVLDSTHLPFSITNNNQVVSINKANGSQKGTIKIIKTDSETGKVLLAAVYEIYAVDDIITADGAVRAKKGNLVDTITTGAGGTAESKLLYLGKYSVKEKKAPQGYTVDTFTHTVSLAYGGQLVSIVGTQIGVTDTAQKATIKVIKTDSETGKPLANAVYEIYAAADITTADGTVRVANGALVDTITTSADGTAVSKFLYLGEYSVQEKTATKGYVLDETHHSVTLAYAGQTTTTFEEPLNVMDTAQKACIDINKKGEIFKEYFKDGHKYNGSDLYVPAYDFEGLKDAIYEIYATTDIITADGTVRTKKGDLVDTVKTGEDGTAESKLLYLGDYAVKEKTAPAGFVLDSKQYLVQLNYAGQTTTTFKETISFTDTRQKAAVILKKEMEKNEVSPNPNAYKAVRFGVYTDSDILIDVFTIDENGIGSSSVDLPFGNFYVQELQTADGYNLNTNKYPFANLPQNQTTSFTNIDLNKVDNVTLINTVIRGNLQIIKTCSLFHDPLSYSAYGVYRVNDNVKVTEMLTDFNGFDFVDDLPYSDYYVKEINPPERYHIDDTQYLFSIIENKQVVKMDVSDDPIIGYITAYYTPPQPVEWVYGVPVSLGISYPYFNYETGDKPHTLMLFIVLLATSAIYICCRKHKHRQL